MNAPASDVPRSLSFDMPRGQIAEPGELAWWLRDARARLLEVASGLSSEQLIGAYRPTVNPILWALGHVGFFQEYWAWQHHFGQAPIRPDAELLYNSFEVEHPIRWKLALPPLAQTRAYLDEVQERVLERLSGTEPSVATTYIHRLVTLHEDMHAEAIAFDRNTLGYPAPPLHLTGNENGSMPSLDASGAPWPGDVEIPHHRAFALGATPDAPYVWDNEKWAHPVEVARFRIAKAPVTFGEFAAFVEAKGYAEERHWSPAAWRWLQGQGLSHPAMWHRAPGGGWRVRRFDQWVPLPEHHPVTPISWYEAQAYCAWAGRRLPTEAEWELAASFDPHSTPGRASHKPRYPWGDTAVSADKANLDARRPGTVPVNALPAGDSPSGCRQMIGNAWEW